jgi:hypothetical protein
MLKFDRRSIQLLSLSMAKVQLSAGFLFGGAMSTDPGMTLKTVKAIAVALGYPKEVAVERCREAIRRVGMARPGRSKRPTK